MTQVIRISKPGYNTLTEASVNNYIFSSEYNTLKYSSAILTKTVAISISAMSSGTATGSIAHGLSYYPFFTTYVTSPNESYAAPFIMVRFPTPVGSILYASSYCDNVNINFFIYGINATAGGIGDSFTFYVKVYKNNLGY